jgi:type I restriction-modification system DNA methylase subunit
MFAELVLAFEQEHFADILGDIYMELELGSHWKGQFFTPYNVCRCMAGMFLGNCAEEVDRKGYISINDPTCGGGALLIAAAEVMHTKDVNYQQNALFIAQDVDPVAAQMCYIQMSLLGMAGYVIVGNTLTAEFENYDCWYTPMCFRGVWRCRRLAGKVGELFNNEPPKPPQAQTPESDGILIVPNPSC